MMNRIVVVNIFFMSALFLQAAEKSPSFKAAEQSSNTLGLPFASLAKTSKSVCFLPEEEVGKAVVYLPYKSKIAESSCYASWCESLGYNSGDISVYLAFQKQFELGRFALSTQICPLPNGGGIDPYTRFLCSCMNEAFAQDQIVQMETLNSGRRIAKPKQKPELTLEAFKRFQLRPEGPKTFTLTKQGREAVVYFAMQHEKYNFLLQKFSEKKSIDSGCMEKMQLLAKEFRPEFERMKADGILK